MPSEPPVTPPDGPPGDGWPDEPPGADAPSPPPWLPPPTTPPWTPTPPPHVPPPGAPSTPPGAPSTPSGPPPGHAPRAGRVATPRRLHPASILLGIPLAQLVQAILFPAFATFAAGGAVTLGLLGVVGVVGLVVRVLSWQRELFSFDGEVLRVDSGVISRSHRSLDVARIQQVELARGPLQRLFGLTALRIETAGSASEPEVNLRVLPEADALALRAAVRASKARKAATDRPRATGTDPTADDTEAPAETILRVPLSHVLLASVTGARLLVLPAVIGGALQLLGQQVDGVVEQATDQLIERGLAEPGRELFAAPGIGTILTVTLAVVGLAVLAAMAVGLVRDGNFRIERTGDDLQIRRGLVSTRESVVPLQRVQLVEIRRNWLRRLLGYATVGIRSAGGSSGGEGNVTVPLLPDGDVDRILGQVLPGVEGVPALRAHPPEALRRTLVRWLRPALVALAVAWAVPALTSFPDAIWATRLRWVAALLLPIAAGLSVVEYRHLAHGLTQRIVVARRGALSITTTMAPVVKVQAVQSRQNVFQRRLGLTTLRAAVAGPGAVVEVMDAAAGDATDLHARLTEHAASPIPLLPSGVGDGTAPQP